jgi:hypothetical protein
LCHINRGKLQMKANKRSKMEMLISHIGIQETAVCFMVFLFRFFFCHVKNFLHNSHVQKIAMLSILIKLTIVTTNSFSMFLYGSKVSFFFFIHIDSVE